MSCERFREAITDHACGAAIDDAGAAHLAGCAGCREAFDAHRAALSEVDALLDTSLSVAASADFTARVMERTHAKRPVLVFPRRWAIGLAAAAAVVLAVSFVWRQGDRPDSSDARVLPAEAGSHAAQTTPAPSAPTTRVASAPAAPVASGFSRKDAVASGFSRKDAAVARKNALAEPAVLVPPDQLRAIARLQELNQRGTLDKTQLPAQTPDALSDLIIEPLALSDLTVPDIETFMRSAAGADRERDEKEPRS